MRFSELWPAQREVEIHDYLAELEFPRRALPERPFTVVNFISSADGRATVEGRSAGLGDDGDKALFRSLRRQTDALLAGTGTLRAERYGRVLSNPASRDWRTQHGMRPEPIACTLTRSGSLPLDIPLFAEPEAHVIVFTSADIDTSGVEAQLEIVKLDPVELTFAAALQYLRREYDVRMLLCEGGPRVFARLAHERVADQLFLTLSPKLVGGGTAPTITLGDPLPEPAELTLDGVLKRDSALFLRYGLNPATGDD